MEQKERQYIPHPYELFGVECGKGWYDLLTPIYSYIEDYNKDKKEEEQIKILQIKEKFGGLRVYTNFGTEELYKLIDSKEEESYNVCENCGSRIDVGMRTSGWYMTLCLDCVKKVAKENNYPQRWNRNADDKLFWINTDGTMEEMEKDELP